MNGIVFIKKRLILQLTLDLEVQLTASYVYYVQCTTSQY